MSDIVTCMALAWHVSDTLKSCWTLKNYKLVCQNHVG